MTKPKGKPMAANHMLQKPQTVLTTAPGRFGPYGYGAGLLITDVPPDVAEANGSWLSCDPTAVKAAKAAGAYAVPYKT